MNILLVGGAGYIGSHVAIALINKGYRCVIMDDFSNSHRSVIPVIENISQCRVPVYECSVHDSAAVEAVLREQEIVGVVHLAGAKVVPESYSDPLKYYEANVFGALSLLKALRNCSVRRIVFSSTAAVYGVPERLPVDESHPTRPENPYGWTKLHIERMLTDLAASEKLFSAVSLRYFNPVGSHESHLIGESPLNVPTNLMPVLLDVAEGVRPYFEVMGHDYSTPDGTGVRDFIHVMDLAEGHVAALDYIFKCPGGRHEIFNLGVGRGVSVLEMIAAFKAATGVSVRYKLCPRRIPDVAECWAGVELAKRVLKWEARRDLQQMCFDSWEFRKKAAGESSKGDMDCFSSGLEV